jgi:hypothetical protein
MAGETAAVSDIWREFGDADPEDEWDDNDAFRIRLEILERVVEALRRTNDDRFNGRLSEALRLARKLAAEREDDSVRLERLRAALEAF